MRAAGQNNGKVEKNAVNLLGKCPLGIIQPQVMDTSTSY